MAEITDWRSLDRFRYHKQYGAMGGNTNEYMIVVSVGNMFPADVVVKRRIKNSVLANILASIQTLQQHDCIVIVDSFKMFGF